MLKQGRIQNFSSGVVGVQVHKKTDNVFFSFLFYKGGPFTESSIRGPIVYSLENWETNFFSFFSVAGGGGRGGLTGCPFFPGGPNAYFYTITIFSQFFSHFNAFSDLILSFLSVTCFYRILTLLCFAICTCT